MKYYETPTEYYFRLHHVRPRFKSDIENVLIFFAEELCKIGELPEEKFIEQFNNAIYKYPGNSHRTQKTINNWRTEISSLFGFVEKNDGFCKGSLRAMELAQTQDLIQFFKSFLFSFQYPGAHVKDYTILEQIDAGIHFKPAQYILKLFKYANSQENANIGLTKFELCHCVFNDLRCTRDNQDSAEVWARIKDNRNQELAYDQTGDIVRYTSDILDYMVIANLLVTYDNRTFYLNTLEETAIIKFIESKEWFSGYDTMIANRTGSLEAINACREDWISYVNRDMSDTDFSTDILAFISSDKEELSSLKKAIEKISKQLEELSLNKSSNHSLGHTRTPNEIDVHTTKEIGDMGESLVHSHECMRVNLGGRSDLIHLIKKIPTQFAVGYDIISVELDERKRYIEVKTTISSKPLQFNRVHMTKNEWVTAESNRDRYFIYRLLISKAENKLFLLQDPVGLYKKDLINMVPSNGADITFDPQKVGHFEELLTWKP